MSAKKKSISSSPISNHEEKEKKLIDSSKVKTLVESNKERERQQIQIEISNLLNSNKIPIDLNLLDTLKELIELNSFFLKQQNLNAYTLSLDIRKSTDLMSVCKQANFYIIFINEVIDNSKKIIKEYNGIYDKFTGDGILCHFIETEHERAYLNCIECSIALHNNFKKIYTKHIKNFKLYSADVGIGIGIDYGEVFFKLIEGRLFAIGESVNYSCRLSCAPAYTTYLNINAYHKVITQDIDLNYTFKKTTISIKNKGDIFVYELLFQSN